MLLFIIFIAVVLGGLNITSYLGAVQIHRKKMIFVPGRRHPRPFEQLSSWTSSKKDLTTFKREFRKFIR